MKTIVSKVYQRALDSLQVPIKHFMETGFWNENALPRWEAPDISYPQVRRIARQIAKEAGRPFITATETIERTRWTADTSRPDGHGGYYMKRVKLDEPRWARAYISMPKRKFLLPLVSPLLLAASNEGGSPIYDRSGATLWEFTINDHSFWVGYYDFILTDPDCRKARKLPA
jgi:hypothetical protein